MKWKKWFSHLPPSAGSALLPLDQLPTELAQDTPALHRNLLLLTRKTTNHQKQQKQVTPIGEKERKNKKGSTLKHKVSLHRKTHSPQTTSRKHKTQLYKSHFLVLLGSFSFHAIISTSFETAIFVAKDESTRRVSIIGDNQLKLRWNSKKKNSVMHQHQGECSCNIFAL